MTESINVISIQQSLQDLSDVRDVDRYYLLEEMAKDTKFNKETMLAFDEMYYDYRPLPNVNSFKDILLSQVLMDSRYIPTVQLDITAKGNEPWKYYVPKDVPPKTTRTVLPRRKKILFKIGDKVSNFIAPQGQIIDIVSINNKLLDKYLKSMFMTTSFINEHNLMKNKNFINCANIKVSQMVISLKAIDLEPEYTAFIKNFKDFNVFADKYYTEDSFIIDILRLNLRGVLISYMEDNYIPIEAYKRLLSKEENKKKKVQHDLTKNKLQIKLKVYTNILKNNFGNKYKISGKLSTILTELPKDIQKYVEDEYSKKMTYNEAVCANKCPHVKLFKDMNKVKSVLQKKEYLEQLETFMLNKEELQKFIVCRRCKFNIICPHLYRMIKLTIDNRAGMSIRKELEMYIDPLIDNNFKSYCKICHEQMFDANFDEIQGEFSSYRIIYTELYKFSWSKIFEIYPTLRFNPRITPFDMGNYLIFAFFPLMVKSKIPTVEIAINMYIQSNEVSPTLKVCVLCYIYGYILNIIRAYISDPDPRYTKVGLEENITSRNTSKYAEAILKRFISMHRSIFNTAEDINIEELFTDIYVNIAQVGKGFYIESLGNPNTMIFAKIITDSTFNYAYHIANLIKDVKLELKPTIQYYEKSIEQVLGKSVQSITRGTNSFDYTTIYLPKDDNTLTKTFDDNLHFKTVLKSMQGRAIRNYQVFIQRVKDQEYDMEPLLKKERIYILYSIIMTAICQFVMKATKMYKGRFYTTDPHITAVYNENGIEHNWDTIVYSDGTEVLKKDAGLKKQGRIVNYKSSTTGILRTQTNRLNQHKTREAYFRKMNKKVFFEFYKTRCPKGGLHEFGKAICTKCGYIDNKYDNTYYEKYKKNYEKETEILENAVHSNTKEKKIPRKNVVSDWRYNKQAIIEASKLVSIPLAVLGSIGAMENRTPTEVYTDQKRPDLPKYRNDLQLIMLMDHYYNTACIYNQMRSNNIIEYDQLVKFLKSNGIEASDISNFKNYLPDNLYLKYNKTVDEVRNDKTKSPEEIYKVYLQSLYAFIYDISTINTKTKKIAIYLLNNIINQELATCLSNGKYDRTLFKRKDTSNINLDVTEGNNGYDPVFEEELNPDDAFDYHDTDFPVNAN